MAKFGIDAITRPCKNDAMNILETSAFPPELLAELENAAELAQASVRDPEAMREACERMDRTREEIFRRNGVLDIGVPAIRELRDS